MFCKDSAIACLKCLKKKCFWMLLNCFTFVHCVVGPSCLVFFPSLSTNTCLKTFLCSLLELAVIYDSREKHFLPKSPSFPRNKREDVVINCPRVQHDAGSGAAPPVYLISSAGSHEKIKGAGSDRRRITWREV